MEGSFQLNYSIVSIQEVFKKLKEMIEISSKLKGLFIDIQVKMNKKIQTDHKRIMQVLLNLTTNAIKFTFSGGVTIIVTEENAKLNIQITDTGIGIKPTELEKIFNMFGLADSKVRQVDTGIYYYIYNLYIGIGIGLYLTKHIIKSMGGNLTAVSEVNKGTTFDISLPISQQEEEDIITFTSSCVKI